MACLLRLDQYSIEKLMTSKSVLHFAPEGYLCELFKQKTRRYVAADLNEQLTQNRDYKQLDISDMRSIGNESFDLVIACDVLEHVPNHVQAIEEIFRILVPGGCAILTVPQEDGRQKTFEDPDVIDPDERIRMFGQEDHVRIYGDDFPEFLTAAGFKVETVSRHNFPEDVILTNVLITPTSDSDIRPPCSERRLFFAYRPN
jgi:SAM-dependent methyltransferase